MISIQNSLKLLNDKIDYNKLQNKTNDFVDGNKGQKEILYIHQVNFDFLLRFPILKHQIYQSLGFNDRFGLMMTVLTEAVIIRVKCFFRHNSTH